MNFKEYATSKGEVLLYVGNPNIDKLEKLAESVGDLWHSSHDQSLVII